MINEQKLVAAAIKSRDAWEIIRNGELDAYDLSPEGAIALKLIGEFYDTDSETGRADVGILL